MIKSSCILNIQQNLRRRLYNLLVLNQWKNDKWNANLRKTLFIVCKYNFKWYEEIPVIVHFQSCVLYFINVFNFLQLNSVGVASRLKTRSSKGECGTGDQTIILGLQIFLDHRSLSSIGQKILMILPHPLFHPPWMFSESYSSSFCLFIFLPFCLFVFLS